MSGSKGKHTQEKDGNESSFIRDAYYLTEPVLDSISELGRDIGRNFIVGAEDGAVQTASALTYVAGGEFGQPLDQRLSTRVEADMTGFLQNAVSHTGVGRYNIFSAAGWLFPKEATSYNGRPISEDEVGKPLPFFSLFVYNPDGKLEIVDYGSDEYYKKVVPYIGGQVLFGKALASLGNLENTSTAISKVLGSASRTLFSADVIGGITQITDDLRRSLILPSEAMDRMSHILSTEPPPTLERLTQDVSIILDEFSADAGPRVRNVYIRSPRTPEDTLRLLENLSKGKLQGDVRDHPLGQPVWDDAIRIHNLQEINSNPTFRRDYEGLVLKALRADQLSDNEIMMLRFGTNIMFGTQMKLSGDDPKSATAQQVYTQSQKDEVLNFIKREYCKKVLLDKTGDTYLNDEISDKMIRDLYYEIINYVQGNHKKNHESAVKDQALKAIKDEASQSVLNGPALYGRGF